jgi:hypothetical protein
MKSKIIPVLMSAMFTGYAINSYAQANQQLSNLTSPTVINQSLQPGTNNVINLGSSTRQWKYLYLHDRLYLNGILTMHAPGTTNFFIGPGAGSTSTTGQGWNTATGVNALHSLTTGWGNTANGYDALYYNTTGNGNIANGSFALYSNTTGNNNTANGHAALYYNTSGYENTANGVEALHANTTGYYNTANGVQALRRNTTGYYNTADGYNALDNNTTGRENTATGSWALANNTTGVENTANGYDALYYNTTGGANTANGYYALDSNTSGYFNTAEGHAALYANTTGNDNTALGSYAGDSVTTGSNNTFIGFSTNAGSGNINNATALGNQAVVSASNTVRIGNSAVTSIGGYVGWSNISDGRVKKNIKNNVPGLAFINKLNPITYNLDLDAADRIIQRPALKTMDGKMAAQDSKEEIAARKAKEQVIYTGFIAQEVENAAKEMNYDFSGVDAAKNDKDLYALRYAEFVVPLVKAVQELSKQNQELSKVTQDLSKMNVEKDTKISDLQKQIDELKGVKTTSGTQSTSAQQSATKLMLSSASLDQNNPNPFTGATTIRYSLPAGFRAAQIVVTDNSGKTIKQVPLNTAGNGTVNIDASTLDSGTYNYTLVVDGKVIENKKMIVAH